MQQCLDEKYYTTVSLDIVLRFLRQNDNCNVSHHNCVNEYRILTQKRMKDRYITHEIKQTPSLDMLRCGESEGKHGNKQV